LKQGDYPLNYYNCETSATITATFRLEFYKDNFTLWAYSLVDHLGYESLLESGNAVNTLKVVGKDERSVVEEIKFDSPLRQVVNNNHHELELFRQNAVYMLLANNKLLRFKKTDSSLAAGLKMIKSVYYDASNNRSNIIAFDAKLGKIALIDTADNLIILDDVD
jgi:hypothetical protein